MNTIIRDTTNAREGVEGLRSDMGRIEVLLPVQRPVEKVRY